MIGTQARPSHSVGRRPRLRRLVTILRLVMLVLVSQHVKLRRADHVGKHPRVFGGVRMKNRGTLTIGDKVMIEGRMVPVELVANNGAVLSIGDRVYINYGTTIAAHESIIIGNDVKMGVYTVIADNDQHCIDPARRNELPESKPVVIEDNAFIGDRVTILKGVRIGRNAFIGAGSVVTKDVPADMVVAGNPARILKSVYVDDALRQKIRAGSPA